VPDLKKALKTSLKGARRVALLGIGSELRQDDAAGALVAEKLERTLKPRRAGHPHVKIFHGATAPENLTGEIKRFKPTHIILVDTVEMEEKPGTILLLASDRIGGGVSFSTHKLPAKVLVDYFIRSIGCAVMIIGVQPKSLEFGKPVSRHVQESVREVVGAIRSAL
jgi:hydrogenase 3 maturation protease